MGSEAAVTAVPESVSAAERGVTSRARRGRGPLVVFTLLVAVAVADLFSATTGTHAGALHLIVQRLYYVPILYAAFVFGRRGGVLAAVGAAVPFLMHTWMDTAYRAEGLEMGLEILTFFAVGILVGALRDTEERRTADLRQVSSQLEDAYRKLEERAMQLINVQDYTQSILRSITAGVITVGPDGSVTTANPAAERLMAMSEFDMVPKPISRIFSDDGGIGADVAKVLSGRVPKTLRDTTLITVTGQMLHVQATVSRMRAVGGRILGAVVTLEDVSEIKGLTEQLIRADRLAAMGELTAGVAHEVRNPLGVIRASVQLLDDSAADAARVREASDVVKQEIDRLDKVIKALLDFGRPSPPRLLPIDVHDVLRDVVLFTRQFASRADVRIIERFTKGVPKVMGDPEKLKQVFLNLVTNAVQAMEEQGGDIRITTGVDRGFVTISISDTGPGIPAEALGKVFDPFFSTRSEGTGLGLTIVHRIVDEHDGHIEVDSRPGAGTRFTVSIPAFTDLAEAGER